MKHLRSTLTHNLYMLPFGSCHMPHNAAQWLSSLHSRRAYLLKRPLLQGPLRSVPMQHALWLQPLGTAPQGRLAALHLRGWLPLRLPGSGGQICPLVSTGTLLPKHTLQLMLFDYVVTFGQCTRCCMKWRLQSEYAESVHQLEMVAMVSTLCLCVLCVFTATVAGELPLGLQALDNMQTAAMQQSKPHFI